MMNLKTNKLCCTLFSLLTLFFSTDSQSNSAMSLQSKEIDFLNEPVNRPTKVKFWYQNSDKSCGAQICLSANQKAHRVAIISHGAFGSPREMNWLGYALASQGWVVAGVAHYGESWVYGPTKIDPSTVARFWQRPEDVSFTIDTLAKAELFNMPLNTEKVLMLGHSSGGFTSLALAGAKLELGKSEAYCAEQKFGQDKGCGYGQQNQPKARKEAQSAEMLNKITTLQAQMQDTRIGAVIALDPALGHAVSEKSLQAIQTPTLVIGSVDNDFLPYSAHAKYYAENIADAKLVGVEQGAGHFIYIDQCNSDRKAKGVPLCKDRQGVDRKALQQKILNQLFGFIYKAGLS